jgi:hypothetical protein
VKKTVGVAAASVLLVTSLVWAQGGPPKPTPEFERLTYFAGVWNFTGESKQSPMGPAGKITFKETCEMMDGGFALVCRTEGTSPMGPTKSHSIMSYDPAKKAYTYTAAESNMPAFTAMGQVAGPAWTWNTESNMEGKVIRVRVTVKEAGPSAYDFQMEMAVDKGAFTTISQGKATRAGK